MRKIKENNNINNNKYIWEVEFRGGKSREKYRSKVWVPKSKDPAQEHIAWSIKKGMNNVLQKRDPIGHPRFDNNLVPED
jgi:hypothetical protein